MTRFDQFTSIESAAHKATTHALSERLLGGSLTPIFDSPERRQSLILDAIAKTLCNYGTHWVGQGAPAFVAPCSRPLPTPLTEFLDKLRKVSRYLSLHIFDVFDHERRTIASVFTEAMPPQLTHNYVAIEEKYRQFARARVPTLVQWMQETLAKEPRHESLALNSGTLNLAGSPTAMFPKDYCIATFRRFGWDPLAPRTIDMLIATDLIGREAHPEFANQLSEALHFTVSPRDAASVALALYLWEAGLPEIHILPYYVRLFAWQLTGAAEEPGADLAAVVGGLSCTFKDPNSVSDEILFGIDSLARGIAGAVAFFGLQLARMLFSRVQLPLMLEHELGQDIGQLLNLLAGSARIDHGYMHRELTYFESRFKQLSVSASLEAPTVPSARPESRQMWTELFADMCRRGAPPTRHVTLVVESRAGTKRLRLDGAGLTGRLRRLPWPPPLACARAHLRAILANLIKNALKADAKQIELRFHPGEGEELLSIDCWDDGRPMPMAPGPRFGTNFGLRLIEKDLRAIGHGASLDVPWGKSGEEKVFRLTLPVTRHVREGAGG